VSCSSAQLAQLSKFATLVEVVIGLIAKNVNA
jgi:hypothetical protein